ncbi:MAG: cysteine desulfurase/selenocysteine lyase [Pseudohongiellaceae bacterium]|jgi:cysteine desulfurase/selenocysteine lyase
MAPGASGQIGAASGGAPFGVSAVRARFPALAGDELVPLDNAATTHRPQAVLDALQRFYVESNANVHRANHRLGMAATAAYEGSRRRVARFIEAEPDEVVFTRNATDSINLVARGFVEPLVGPGKSVVVSALEHHSNLVPWQQVCRRTGARLAVLECDERGQLREPFEFPADAAFVAATRVSNALGTIVPTDRLVAAAAERGLPVLLDVTQSVQHLPLDEGCRQADFLAFSGHKMYGPMGLGVLVGRRGVLERVEPVVFGGEMVASVDQDGAQWQRVPYRFEAGTPAVAPAAALVPALDLLDELGLDAVRAHERRLLDRLLVGLEEVGGVLVLGPQGSLSRSGSVSMAIPGGDVHLAATVLDMAGVAVRAGWHCAEPLLTRLGAGPTLRASLALYNTAEDIDRLLAVLPEAVAACR